MEQKRVHQVRGSGCVLRGHDIDTDRIIPARYLRAVTFDGLGEHAFKDDRAHAKGDHALDDERFGGATILVVGRNFGCGSSREHAPQSLMRHGFQAFVGESFAEIFFGNCVALGLPCVTLPPHHLHAVMEAVELDPEHELILDLEQRVLKSRAGILEVEIPHGAHRQLTEGSWHATAVLLEAGDSIEATAAKLPYTSDFAG